MITRRINHQEAQYNSKENTDGKYFRRLWRCTAIGAGNTTSDFLPLTPQTHRCFLANNPPVKKCVYFHPIPEFLCTSQIILIGAFQNQTSWNTLGFGDWFPDHSWSCRSRDPCYQPHHTSTSENPSLTCCLTPAKMQSCSKINTRKTSQQHKDLIQGVDFIMGIAHVCLTDLKVSHMLISEPDSIKQNTAG